MRRADEQGGRHWLWLRWRGQVELDLSLPRLVRYPRKSLHLQTIFDGIPSPSTLPKALRPRIPEEGRCPFSRQSRTRGRISQSAQSLASQPVCRKTHHTIDKWPWENLPLHVRSGPSSQNDVHKTQRCRRSAPSCSAQCPLVRRPPT